MSNANKPKQLDQPGSGTYSGGKTLDQPGSGIDSVRQNKSK